MEEVVNQIESDSNISAVVPFGDIKKKVSSKELIKYKKNGFNEDVFTNEQEQVIAKQCEQMAALGRKGFSLSQLMEMVLYMSEALRLNVHPTKYWCHRFLDRRPELKVFQVNPNEKPHQTPTYDIVENYCICLGKDIDQIKTNVKIRKQYHFKKRQYIRISERIPKPNRLKEEKRMMNAIKDIRNGMSINTASSLQDIPEATLRSKLKRLKDVDIPWSQSYTFSAEQEDIIAKHCLAMSRLQNGLSRLLITKMAGVLAEALGLERKPSKWWCYAFLDRFPHLRTEIERPTNERIERESLTSDIVENFCKAMAKDIVKCKSQMIETQNKESEKKSVSSEESQISPSLISYSKTRSSLLTPKLHGVGNISLEKQHEITSGSEEEDLEIGKCAVCNRWEPEQLKYMPHIKFAEWGQCNICKKWIHLQFCSDVEKLGPGDVFTCLSCLKI